MDRYLDTLRTGPSYLRLPHVAQLVVNSIRRGVELGHYRLRAWAVMPNHVHLLLLPLISPSRRLQSLKRSSAREVNLALGELERIAAYLENNPVKAGLVVTAPEWQWSSAASVETNLDAASTSACATTASRVHPEM